MTYPRHYDRKARLANLLQSVLHNIGVLIVGFVFALIGRAFDSLLGMRRFDSASVSAAGWVLLTIGFLIRVWAAFYFYEQHMIVISLVPQKKLITGGPFRFSRNPLYLGGNVFIFLGAVLLLGSPTGVILTMLNVFAVDLMIRREEKQLEREFGDEFQSYRQRVRRWL